MPTPIDVLGALLVFAVAAGFYAALFRLINGARSGRARPACLRPASRGDHGRCKEPGAEDPDRAGMDGRSDPTRPPHPPGAWHAER